MRFPKISIKIRTDLDEEKIIKRISKLFSDRRIRYKIEGNEIISLRVPFFRSISEENHMFNSFRSQMIDTFLMISYCNAKIMKDEEKNIVIVECGLKRIILVSISPLIIVIGALVFMGIQSLSKANKAIEIGILFILGSYLNTFIITKFNIENEFKKYLRK